MTHVHETVEFAQEQLALTDDLLAINSLTRTIGSAEEAVNSAARNLRFTGSYRPTPPGPRPHPEAGGMDHQDWQVASLEYAQYDRETEMRGAEADLDEAEWKLSDLQDLRAGVEAGDETVIAKVAGSERSRLLEVINRAARAQERKGKEFEGGKELFQAIAALQGDNDKLKAATEKTGPNGWQRANYRPTWSNGSVFRVNPEEGPLKSFGSYTKLLEISAGKDQAVLHYSEMPENARVTYVNADWRAVTVDYYTLTLDKHGVATGQAHRHGDASQQRYIGSKYSHIYQPVHNYEGIRELDFTQADIDKFRDILAQVSADVEAVQS